MTPEESAALQAKTGALTQLLTRQLGARFLGGDLSDVELVAAWIAAQRLGHERAAQDMADFVAAYRRQQLPGKGMPDPVQAVFSEHLAAWRAWQVAEAARRDDPQAAVEALQRQAGATFRDTLDAGRDTAILSAAVARTTWRRKTAASCCAWCAMLATRSDYKTRESAISVVGRRGKLRGDRPAGSRFHDRCACTVVEVIGDQPVDETQAAQRAAYRRAVEACKRDGVPLTASNIVDRMRGGPGFTDSRKPASAGHGGGGRKPPPEARGGDDLPEPGSLLKWRGKDAPQTSIPLHKGEKRPLGRLYAADFDFRYIADPKDRATGVLQYQAAPAALAKEAAHNINNGRDALDGLQVDHAYRSFDKKPSRQIGSYSRNDFDRDIRLAAHYLATSETTKLGFLYRGISVRGGTVEEIREALRLGDWRYASATRNRQLASRYATSGVDDGATPVLLEIEDASGVILDSVGGHSDRPEYLLSGDYEIVPGWESRPYDETGGIIIRLRPRRRPGP